jgi:putative endonuclease
MTKQYYVYIITSKSNTVLYTGITNDLKRRIFEHKQELVPGFSKRYKVSKLVYYEQTNDVTSAILREKQIKAGSRKKKLEMIARMNKEWRDLYEDL